MYLGNQCTQLHSFKDHVCGYLQYGQLLEYHLQSWLLQAGSGREGKPERVCFPLDHGHRAPAGKLPWAIPGAACQGKRFHRTSMQVKSYVQVGGKER